MKYLVFLIYFFIIYKEAQSSDILSLIKLPNSFSVSIFTNVPNARQMALTPDGILFVGSRSAGKVYAIQDLDYLLELLLRTATFMSQRLVKFLNFLI